jgi:hypothetical protein
VLLCVNLISMDLYAEAADLLFSRPQRVARGAAAKNTLGYLLPRMRTREGAGPYCHVGGATFSVSMLVLTRVGIFCVGTHALHSQPLGAGLIPPIL